MKISYAITVCNEFIEIQRLVNFLLQHKRMQDNIVILFDEANGDPGVETYLRSHSQNGEFHWHKGKFDRHFADWKNKLTSLCSGDYIFQIDADEIPSEDLIKTLPELLELNPEMDVFLVPRVNTVENKRNKIIIMTYSSPLTFCISTYNNLPYLKLAIYSVRKNSYYKDAPFIIHAENCTDGTNEWLEENKDKYNLTLLVEPENINVRGIGGGMNICADHTKTEYIMFLHSDFYVSKNWDLECLKIFDKYPNIPMWVFSHRIQPNIFNEDSRAGTLIVPNDYFGAYHDDFTPETFLQYAQEFSELNDFEIDLGEGVSGLIRKKDWDHIGGNDPIFSPTSWEDKDLFLRMVIQGYKFVVTSKSVVWHFGARGSHRLEENNGKSAQRQMEAERKNVVNWLNKWGKMPVFNENGFIKNW
jgi:GT2 family glycosyltransferase